MTLDQLEMVEAVVEHGSYRAAAEKLHKSQPSLSVGIKNLEDRLGVQIFDRQGYRPVLTEAGHLFHAKMQESLSQFRQLRALGEQLSQGVESQVRLGIDPLYPLKDVASELKDAFQAGYYVQADFKEYVLQEGIDALLLGELDFVIGAGFRDDPRLECLEVLTVTMSACRVHQAAPKGKVAKKASVPRIVVSSESQVDRMEVKGYVWKVASHELKEQLISSGLGWGYLPDDYIRSHRKLARLRRPKIELVLYLYRNKETATGPLCHTFWSRMKERSHG